VQRCGLNAERIVGLWVCDVSCRRAGEPAADGSVPGARQPATPGTAVLPHAGARGCGGRGALSAPSSRTDSPRSRDISTKVGVDSAMRNMVVYRGGVTTPKHTFMGVDNAGVCLSVVLINLHERDLAL